MNKENYILKESTRSRCIRVTVKSGGEVVITKPRRAPLFLVKHFVQKNSAWIEKMVERAKSQPKKKLAKVSEAEFLAGKKQGLEFLRARVVEVNSFYGFEFKKISVKNNSSRLGSCSRSGNLNFSYSILRLPTEAIDYVIVHELCHLKEFNHSSRFWDLVALVVPDYKKTRKNIRSG
ncbi:MAG: M48 family metallopeptidase [Patescibacteria group bacterium]